MVEADWRIAHQLRPAVRVCHARNPKAEIRNPKEGRSPNSEMVGGGVNGFERHAGGDAFGGVAVPRSTPPQQPTKSAKAAVPKSEAAPAAAAASAYDPEVGF